jgi:hypothetical protein
MRRRGKFIVAVVAGAFLTALATHRFLSAGERAVEAARRELRQQGFKTDLTEFDFSTSADASARAEVLLAVARTREPILMEMVASNSAAVLWRDGSLQEVDGQQSLPALEESLDEEKSELDAACQAALSGPIRFNTEARHGFDMLLPHLPAVKSLARLLASRVIVNLRHNSNDTAWTNLLALTRLVSAWSPDAAEVSHLVRCQVAATGFDAVWQALQAGCWDESRLAVLQQEWESVDFLGGLPETAAFERAGALALCRQERERPKPGFSLKTVLQSPRSAWWEWAEVRRRFHYRNFGGYNDEKSVLLHYRDRELLLRRVAQSQTWAAIKDLPGVTNPIPLRGLAAGAVQMRLDHKALTLHWLHWTLGDSGLVGLAAEMEARRRLVVAAIALERYRRLHGSFPQTPGALVPALLKSEPLDFADGQPIRYHLGQDGRFLLYSVGLDLVDNGGIVPQAAETGAPKSWDPPGIRPGADLVWPLPAAPKEVAARRANEEKARAAAQLSAEQAEAAEEERREAKRRATVQKLLSTKQPERKTEPSVDNRPLSAVLRNVKTTGTNSLTLDQLLTLKRVSIDEGAFIAAFELPIRYEALTNLGALELLVDAPLAEDEADEKKPDILVNPPSPEATFQDCVRASNGNCLLEWNTLFEPYGAHALQAQLRYHSTNWHQIIELRGPVAPFFSSNLCQFSESDGVFTSRGAFVHARLPESNATYTVELKSEAGEEVRTFRGTTTNGWIEVDWDARDARGILFTNDSLDAIYHITLPQSERSQTIKTFLNRFGRE